MLAGRARDASGNRQVLVARLNANGSFDPSFGTGGKLIVQLGVGAMSDSEVSAVAVQGDGKIVFAGEARDASRHAQVLVGRLKANGSFDSSFGAGGK